MKTLITEDGSDFSDVPVDEGEAASNAIVVNEWDSDTFHHRVLDLELKGYVVRRETYRNFRNDPVITSTPGVNLGLNPTDAGKISFLDRDVPLRSRALVTRASVHGSVGERLHVVLRGLHDDERMKAPYLETVGGTASNNANIISRVLTGDGAVKRPGAVVDAGATFDINKNFSINDSFRYTSFRIAGQVATLQPSVQRTGSAPPQTIITTTEGDRLTKWTSYWNTLSLDANFGRKFSANLGWRAMQREVSNSRFRKSTELNVI